MKGRSLNQQELTAALDRAFGPTRPVSVVELTSLVEPWLERPRFLAAIFGLLAIASLLITGVGVAMVARRVALAGQRELAVRMALGANVRDLVWNVGGGILLLVATGLGAGALVTWWAGGLLDGLLFEVSAKSPVIILVVAAFLAAGAGVAVWLPSRRARVLPMAILRAVDD